MEKWPEIPFFEPFSGRFYHFSLISQARPKSIFRPFSSPFRTPGPKWICTRPTGLQDFNLKKRIAIGGNANRYTKRPLQDSAIIFSIFGLGVSAFYCANHRVFCKYQQPPGWKIHRFLRWKMPYLLYFVVVPESLSYSRLHLSPGG